MEERNIIQIKNVQKSLHLLHLEELVSTGIVIMLRWLI